MPKQLSFYNSLTKKVESFSTQGTLVQIYNCGPTVYKRQHIGNMRRFLFADFLRRTLEFSGLTVREITNITDVGHLTQDDIDAGEDKLEAAAREAKVSPQDIARQQTQLFFEDLKALTIQPASHYPRASEHIQEMHGMITRLIERGHAYITDTGVYFDVRSFPAYGQLSGNTLTALSAGSRVEVREEKKHPADFALWKIAEPGHLQQWDSPWGRGYPGWHIECSAMSLKYLESPIDIHTGGQDNRFPHHENEIAQSEGATNKPFVRLWMHNAFLNLKGAKLAKRGGEQITLTTIRDKGFSLLAFRLFVFASHYRSPIDFSWEGLAAAQRNISSLRQLVRRLLERAGDSVSAGEADVTVITAFHDALADDLNTPAALAHVLTYAKELNTKLDEKSGISAPEAARALATWRRLDAVLGIVASLEEEVAGVAVPADVERLSQEREAARAAKDFALADEVRKKIEQRGFTIEDTPEGPRILPG